MNAADHIGGMEMDRTTADRIATDLIEGGVTDTRTTSNTAAAHCVTVTDVRRVRRYLLKRGSQYAVTQADMIAKGWDDAELGVKP